MKYILFVISFIAIFLLKAGWEANDFPVEQETEAVCTSQNLLVFSEGNTPSTGAILPIDADKLLGDMVYSDTQALARQLNVSSARYHRFTTLQHTLFSKSLMRKIALWMASMAQCATQVHTTLPSQGWETSSEHYIFGMRRILI